jgi:hypothetical protein
MFRRAMAGGLLVVAMVAGVRPAAAQQRPLVTQDPETIGSGRVLVEGGFDYGRDVTFPASGLTGNLLRIPLIGASVGISSIADIQLTGGLYDRLSITGTQRGPLYYLFNRQNSSVTDDVEDMVLATKIRVVSETGSRPAIGLRFATKLPNDSQGSGIGLDTTDFFVTALGGKTFHSTRVVGNLGLGILQDPTRGGRQNDALVLGFSVARALSDTFELVGEVNGRVNTRSNEVPPGTESRGMIRAGARYTRGAGRFDAALLFGLTSYDPEIGFTFGYTYVFEAFKIQ